MRQVLELSTTAKPGVTRAQNPASRGIRSMVPRTIALVALVALVSCGSAAQSRSTLPTVAPGGSGAVTVSSQAVVTPSTTGNAPVVTTPTSASLASNPPGATTSTATPAGSRVCDKYPGQMCIEIRSIAISGNSLVIEWDAHNFKPDVKGFHAHFFWDTFSPKEAGTNAAKFGASVGRWELTDQQPFRSQLEMRLANRPPAAKQVCVTVGDKDHALVNPDIYECVPIPSS